jgi:hypothetical protein
MFAPSAQAILKAWENARQLTRAQRADLLLAAAMPHLSADQFATMSLGRRDALLLELRHALFGTRLSATSTCGRCGQVAQMEFDLSDILLAPSDEPAETEFSIGVGGYDCTFRLPRGADLDVIADSPDAAAASRLLLARCLKNATRDGQAVPIEEIDDHVRAAIGAEMAKADPQADIRLSLVCPNCSHGWSAPFDPMGYLWVELEAWAMRTFHEVHSLARKYGWRESDILAMSPARRQIYLEMSDG